MLGTAQSTGRKRSRRVWNWPDLLAFSTKDTVNPFLPSLATAVLACWPEAAVKQLQNTDCLNPKGCNLPRRAHNVFRFGRRVNNWMVISVMLILSLLGGFFLIFFIKHVTLFEHLYRSHVDMIHHMVSQFHTSTRFILLQKIIARIIRFFVRTWFLTAVAAVVVIVSYSPNFRKHVGSFFLKFLFKFYPLPPPPPQKKKKIIGTKAAWMTTWNLWSKGKHFMHQKGKRPREKGSFIP